MSGDFLQGRSIPLRSTRGRFAPIAQNAFSSVPAAAPFAPNGEGRGKKARLLLVRTFRALGWQQSPGRPELFSSTTLPSLCRLPPQALSCVSFLLGQLMLSCRSCPDLWESEQSPGPSLWPFPTGWGRNLGRKASLAVEYWGAALTLCLLQQSVQMLKFSPS